MAASEHLEQLNLKLREIGSDEELDMRASVRQQVAGALAALAQVGVPYREPPGRQGH
jgi:hypothetical protein